MSFANLVSAFDPDGPDPRHEAEVFLTRAELTAMTRDFDRVRSPEDFGDALARHVGPEFVDVARRHFFRVLLVCDPLPRGKRWRLVQ